MPIYAYRCSTCGHTKDVLQKMSDPVLAECPACGAQTYVKQVTAAGFQLKGSGWYVTDFKGGDKPAAAPAEPAAPDASKGDATQPAPAPALSSKNEPAKPDGAKREPSKREAAPAAAPAPAPAPVPAATPVPGSK